MSNLEASEFGQNPNKTTYVKNEFYPPPNITQGKCRPGYYDSTNGKTNRWRCGQNCIGGRFLTDNACNCACKPVQQVTTI